MAVKIRLSRIGTTNKPVYRIVVVDESKKRDGKVIEILGNYNPRQNPPQISINKTRANQWLKNGAKPSPTVANLL